jgi:hypothetical protein
MSFRIQGLDPTPFRHLIGLSDAALIAHGARRYVVDADPGFPDRIEVRDLAIGETAILLNYEHQPADTPYRSRHAIFIGEASTRPLEMVDDVPDALRRRPISLRSFTATGEMLDADLSDGKQLIPVIERLFAAPAAAYLHAHYAKRGCYAARIIRA